jgi:hypothetical protein
LPRKTDSNNQGDWIFFAESEIQGLETLAERELSYPMCQSKLPSFREKLHAVKEVIAVVKARLSS